MTQWDIFKTCFSTLLDWARSAFSVGRIFPTTEAKPSHGLLFPILCVLWFFSTLYSGSTKHLDLCEHWRWFYLLLWGGSPEASGIFPSVCPSHPSSKCLEGPSANSGDHAPRTLLSVVLGPAILFSPNSPLHLLTSGQWLVSICVPPPAATTQSPSPGGKQGQL